MNYIVALLLVILLDKCEISFMCCYLVKLFLNFIRTVFENVSYTVRVYNVFRLVEFYDIATFPFQKDCGFLQ